MLHFVSSVIKVHFSEKQKTTTVSGVDYNPACSDELHSLGFVFCPVDMTYVHSSSSEKIYEEAIKCCEYYFGASKAKTAGQRKFEEKLARHFTGTPESDFVFHKDDSGFSFYDLNGACGTPEQIAQELNTSKICTVRRVFRRRIYIKLPNTTTKEDVETEGLF